MQTPIKLITAALVICSFAACKKQLNVFPTTTEVDGNIIVDVNSAQSVLNGVYYRFAGAGFDYNNTPALKWVDLQEGSPSGLSGLVTYPYGGSEFADHTYNSTSFTVESIWAYNYDIINSANGFLKNITPVSVIEESIKSKMIAEAKFLRAYANTNLLLYFGQYDDATSKFGNMLRTEFVQPDNIVLPRSTVAETYDNILTDLDDAIAALPDLNTSNIYANVWAAKLLKARLLINRNAQGDDAEVINLAKDIIANSSFTLEENEKEIFLDKNIKSNEVMLGVQPYKNQAYKYQEYLYFNQYIASSDLVNLFAGDPRSRWVFKNSFNDYIGDSIPVITKYYPGDVANPNPDAVTEYCYAFRLTEAYLLEAEAMVATGGSMNEAKSLLKIVLQHAGYTDFSEVDAANTQAELQLLTIKEEMKNFVAESGQDWFAVRRLPFATLQSMIPTIKTKELLLLPIPENEITRNSKVEQNPGY